MDLRAAGLKEQPFRARGEPLVFVGYAGQQKACEFFEQTAHHNSGLGLFQGPHLSGKSAIIRDFARSHADDLSIAIIDGNGLAPAKLLEAILNGFGFQHKFDTVNELLNMVSVFCKQQTVSGQAPLLFIENTHTMSPAALNVICELAGIRVREKYALRMVLASDRSIEYISSAPAMDCIAKRLTGNFHLEPLTIDETSDYLYAKMRTAGCIDPDFVFPDAVCDELYRSSGGWPGVLDHLALLAIEHAEVCPVGLDDVEHPPKPVSTRPDSKEPDADRGSRRTGPLLFLTRNGETLRKIRFDGPRVLIGRTEHNDVHIDSKFISRHHALLVRHGDATLLMDLNSANGTFVNSRRISNQVLANEDVITVGDYGIKFVDPAASQQQPVEGISLDDTVIMMTLDDMRKVLARENTEMLPVPPPAEESA
jgi:type II secretory pathway predicted ATPase ExeA